MWGTEILPRLAPATPFCAGVSPQSQHRQLCIDSSPHHTPTNAEPFASKAADIGPLKCLSFSSDGSLVALGGEDGSIQIARWPTLERKLYWKGSEDKAIRSADFSGAHNDGILLTTDESGAAILWNAETGERVLQLQAPSGERQAFFVGGFLGTYAKVVDHAWPTSKV